MSSFPSRLRLGLLLVLGLVSGLRADETGQPPAIDDIPQDSPDTALAKACADGDVSAVMNLIEEGAPVNAPFGKYQFTPLMVAATKHFDVTLYLISKGARVDDADSEGNTALLHASFLDSNDCALELLSAGADPNLPNQAGRSPLMNAARNGNDALVKALIEHHVDVNAISADGSALSWAVTKNKMSTVKLLIDAGADPRLKAKTPPDPKNPRLSLAEQVAATGSLEMLDLLLDHGLDIDGPGDDGATALMVAAQRNRTDIVGDLLRKGAEVNRQNLAGETALMIAAKYDRPLVVDALHQSLANMELKDRDGKTALIWAGASRSNRAARYLIDDGADIDAKDDRGETALTWAGDSADTELVDMLKQKGALRTDVHIIAKADPPQPLSHARAWAMAVGVIYMQKSGLDPRILGGTGDAASEQNVLRRDWNVTDNASLARTLDDLQDRGDRTLYQSEGTRLGMMTGDQFNQLVGANLSEAGRIKAMRSSYFKWKERSGLAWDLCRAANLVNVGFAAGYLDENDAWTRLLAIARQTQGSFASWKELSDNFLSGREIWAGKRDPHFDACIQLLLNPQDPNSPWNQNPWKTDLSDPAKPAN